MAPRSCLDAPDLTRDAIMRYIIETKEVSPKADGSWALLAAPAGVTTTFTYRAERRPTISRRASRSRRWATRRKASSIPYPGLIVSDDRRGFRRRLF